MALFLVINMGLAANVELLFSPFGTNMELILIVCLDICWRC